MKGIIVVLGGMGDLPNKQLNGMTPLEAASTPNLDFFAARGKMGMMFPVKPNFVPEADEAIVSMFGDSLIASTRGVLEAMGAGLNFTRGDLALRANFTTIQDLESKKVIDRRAGRTLTTVEAEDLAHALNTRIKLPIDFEFKPTVEHGAVLIFRGGFSEMISGNGFAYVAGKAKDPEKFGSIKPLDDDENSQYSANVVNEFLEAAYHVLKDHPVNKERIRKGLMPANYLLVRGAGIESLKFKQYRKWMSISYMPLEIGFSKASGMNGFSFEPPALKKLDFYSHLHDVLKKACKFSVKTLKKHHKKYEYAYIHIKETDTPGHDNKPLEKKAMLEFIDKNLFGFLKKFCPPHKIQLVVTADHSTPCRLKEHSEDPVPVLWYDFSIPKEKKFSEKDARLGSLGRFNGNELLPKVGFVK